MYTIYPKFDNTGKCDRHKILATFRKGNTVLIL